MLLGLLATFVLLTALVMAGQADRFDEVMIRATHRLLSPGLTSAIEVVSAMGGKVIAVLPVLVVGLLAQRRPRAAAVVLGVGLGSVALNTPLKVLIHRTPPGPLPPSPMRWSPNPLDLQQYLSNNYSFPSGHVLAATVIGGLMIYVVRSTLGGWTLALATACAGLAVAAVGFSRVYLGTYHPLNDPNAVYYARHYPTDVLGALLLGGAWLIFAILILQRLEARDEGGPRSE